MANLSDLINKAKNGKPLKNMLGLAEVTHNNEIADPTNMLLEQITSLEVHLRMLPEELLRSQAPRIIKDLEQLIVLY